jgi:hypothetical protein
MFAWHFIDATKSCKHKNKYLGKSYVNIKFHKVQVFVNFIFFFVFVIISDAEHERKVKISNIPIISLCRALF